MTLPNKQGYVVSERRPDPQHQQQLQFQQLSQQYQPPQQQQHLQLAPQPYVPFVGHQLEGLKVPFFTAEDCNLSTPLYNCTANPQFVNELDLGVAAEVNRTQSFSAIGIEGITSGPVDELQIKKNYLRNHRLLPVITGALSDCRKEGLLGAIQPPPSFQQQEPGTVDYSLDEFLSTHGLDGAPMSPASPSSPNGSGSNSGSETGEFNAKLDRLKREYEEELNKITHVCNDFCSRMMNMLREQSHFRPVGHDEIHLKLAGIQHRFDAVKAQLKQNVCSAILVLQKQYNHSARKRRSLSKSATEVLNKWFFEHIKDPYPSDEEKMVLASQCMLTLNQINNWFGNKRIRYKRKCWEEHKRKNKEGAGLEGSMEDLPPPTGRIRKSPGRLDKESSPHETAATV